VTMKSLNTASAQLAMGALIAAAVFAAYLIGGQEIGEALFAGGIVLAFMVLIVVARRRSDTFDVMSGIGDERTRSLYQRAVAFAGTVMSFVLPGWWLVTVAQGEPNTTLALLCAIFALVWLAAVVVLSRRS
jgi:Predicted membrane protein (DUF2178)